MRNIFKSIGRMMSNNAPMALLTVGIVGSITSTVLAVKVTPKAVKLLEEEKISRGVEKLEIKDVVKTTWKLYIPTVAVGLTSFACIMLSTNILNKRNASWALAYAAAGKSLNDYREIVIKELGEEKAREISDKVATKTVVEAAPNKSVKESTEIAIIDDGLVLCYDSMSGRYFKTTVSLIKRAENEINTKLRDEMWVSLNDMYSELGMRNVGVGEDLGWNVDDGMVDCNISSTIMADGKPCLMLEFWNAPMPNYR